MCVIDWGALGTWVIGVAAIWIAYRTHGLNDVIRKANDDHASVAAEAYAASALVELKAINSRVNGVMRGLRSTIDGEQRMSTKALLNAIRSVPGPAPSEHLLTSPAIGHLPRPLARQLGRCFASAIEKSAELRYYNFVAAEMADVDEAVVQEAFGAKKMTTLHDSLARLANQIDEVTVEIEHAYPAVIE